MNDTQVTRTMLSAIRNPRHWVVVAFEHLHLLSLLDFADLTGISIEELARVRRQVMENHREQAMREAIELLPGLASVAD